MSVPITPMHNVFDIGHMHCIIRATMAIVLGQCGMSVILFIILKDNVDDFNINSYDGYIVNIPNE